MKSEKDILLEKMNKALQKRDYVKVTQIKTQLDNLNKYELIPVKDLFGNMTKEQKEKAVYVCKKIPLFPDLLSQAAIELTNIIQQVDSSSNLVLMKDLSKFLTNENECLGIIQTKNGVLTQQKLL